MTIEAYEHMPTCTLTEDENARSLVDIDLSKYRPMLDGIEISEAQAEALLIVIRDMLLMMIELNIPSENWGQIMDGIIIRPDSGDLRIE